MELPRWLEGKSDEEVISALRAEVDNDHTRLADVEKLMFFYELVDETEEELAGQWDAYCRHVSLVDERVSRLRTAALARFDREVAPLPPADAAAVVYSDDAFWFPGFVAERRHPAEDPWSELTPEEKLEHAILGTRPARWNDPPYERRCAARRAAELRDYAVWRSTHQLPDLTVRLAAESRVARDRAVIERRFADGWGIEMPDAIFRYWLFLLSLGPVEQRVLHDMELRPYGIMNLFDDPACLPREGLDVRVHGRYYRDPPEFLTFMHGGTDGLHFGLWYDDGRTCTGVASYYNNDGGGVGLPSGTPLEAVREQIEWRQAHLDSEAGEGEPIAANLAEERFRLRALREVLMTFETGDRPEEGNVYHETYRDGSEVLEDGDPSRFETLDGGGALADGESVVPRGRQRPYDRYDWCTNLHNQLIGDPGAVAAWVTEALRRCAAGDPTSALTLGRDLHWASGGDVERERQAHELLVAAYRALGRHTLAGITDAHHRHRDLPQVGVLRT
ncbi:DUF2228 domain-containing protein [Actinomadura verrucosospora]|uniref:DUF2228 domain-containing protein n=1 Tax=Actinomadura verrucosospora TaxID=46165 RepID=UPI0015651333|nr:DUF2228 domain-containing protein [Actinomadura verrucosospora]